MSSPKTVTRRLATLLVAAAALSGAGILSLASPASAAPLGTLTITATSGTVTQNPMFPSAQTSAACPVGYGTNATLAVRATGSTGVPSPLRAVGSAGNYDTAPFSLSPIRSMVTALFGPGGGTVAAGSYDIVVICTGELLGDNPEFFVTQITVTGTNWATGGGSPPATPPLGAGVRIEATVAGGPTMTTPAAGGGGGLPVTGTSLALMLVVGLGLIGGGAGAVVAARRRRGHPS